MSGEYSWYGISTKTQDGRLNAHVYIYIYTKCTVSHSWHVLVLIPYHKYLHMYTPFGRLLFTKIKRNLIRNVIWNSVWNGIRNRVWNAVSAYYTSAVFACTRVVRFVDPAVWIVLLEMPLLPALHSPSPPDSTPYPFLIHSSPPYATPPSLYRT